MLWVGSILGRVLESFLEAWEDLWTTVIAPRQSECAKIHALFDKKFKKVLSGMKSVKLSHPPLLWWVKG